MKINLLLAALILFFSLNCLSAEADVVVYGGTPGGIAAAVAASRGGAKVLLVEPYKHVGGLNTSGINTAESEHMFKWTIGGLALEFYQRLGKHYGTNHAEYFFESSTAEKVFLEMLKEANVEIHYGAVVTKVEKDGAHLKTISLSDGTVLAASVFIDASYEGDLMARSGVKYTWGREARSEFDESLAGIRLDKTQRTSRCVDEKGNLLPGISVRTSDLKEGDGDRKVMNYNFRLCLAKSADKRVPFPEPKHYDPARWEVLRAWVKDAVAKGKKLEATDFLDFYSRRNGKYECNNKQAAIISLGHFGGQFDYPDADYPRRAEIIEDHREYTLGLLHFLSSDPVVPEYVRNTMKTWGLHKDEFADNGNWPYQLYVREARRMRGATVVTQKDIRDDRHKDDAIGISSHFVDCHHVERATVNDNAFVNEGRIWQGSRAYQIPYRAITPMIEEADNLLVPVAASYTHVAYCTLRLESVWMITGHAAGNAAAMAVKEKTSVQKVNVAKLQASLREQKQVVDFKAGEKEIWDSPTGPPEF